MNPRAPLPPDLEGDEPLLAKQREDFAQRERMTAGLEGEPPAPAPGAPSGGFQGEGAVRVAKAKKARETGRETPAKAHPVPEGSSGERDGEGVK